jgi:hypothetical protein
MPYNFLNTIKDNLECNTDLDLNPFKRWAQLDYNLTTPDDDIQNKILSLLLLAAACSNSS